MLLISSPWCELGTNFHRSQVLLNGRYFGFTSKLFWFWHFGVRRSVLWIVVYYTLIQLTLYPCRQTLIPSLVELEHDKTNKMNCKPREESDHHGHHPCPGWYETLMGEYLIFVVFFGLRLTYVTLFSGMSLSSSIRGDGDFSIRLYLSHVMRNPVYAICEQQRRR